MKKMMPLIALVWASFASHAEGQQGPAAIPLIRGQVQSVGGLPVADAEVSAEGVRASVRSDARGFFSIAAISKGIHTLTVRRVGYLPAVTTVTAPTVGDSLTIILVPSRPELDTVKVTARVNVLAGVVVDDRNRPISGASVQLNANRRDTVVTGGDGWFRFTAVSAGPTILHVLRAGYVGTMQSVTLQDWRGIVVHMDRIDTTLSKNRQQIISGLGPTARHVWIETQDRLVRRSVWSAILTRDELAPLDDEPLGEAIARVPGGPKVLPDMHSACVLLNGYQVVGQQSLDAYTTEEVEFVELYPPGEVPPQSIQTYMSSAGCRVTRGDAMRRGIYYAVVWLRT